MDTPQIRKGVAGWKLTKRQAAIQLDQQVFVQSNYESLTKSRDGKKRKVAKSQHLGASEGRRLNMSNAFIPESANENNNDSDDENQYQMNLNAGYQTGGIFSNANQANA